MAALIFDFDAQLPGRLYGKLILLPRDALHLSTMARYGINDIVTTDGDFFPVDNLRLYTCNPKVLSRTRE